MQRLEIVCMCLSLSLSLSLHLPFFLSLPVSVSFKIYAFTSKINNSTLYLIASSFFVTTMQIQNNGFNKKNFNRYIFNHFRLIFLGCLSRCFRFWQSTFSSVLFNYCNDVYLGSVCKFSFWPLQFKTISLSFFFFGGGVFLMTCYVFIIIKQLFQGNWPLRSFSKLLMKHKRTKLGVSGAEKEKLMTILSTKMMKILKLRGTLRQMKTRMTILGCLILPKQQVGLDDWKCLLFCPCLSL